MSFKQFQTVRVKVPVRVAGVQIPVHTRCRVNAPLKGDRADTFKGKISVTVTDPKSGELYGMTLYLKPTAFRATERGRPTGSVKRVVGEKVEQAAE